MTQDRLPNLAVLSYREIVSDYEVENVGVVMEGMN